MKEGRVAEGWEGREKVGRCDVGDKPWDQFGTDNKGGVNYFMGFLTLSIFQPPLTERPLLRNMECM